jgi:transposase InsO family protein
MVAENPTWGAPRIHGELKMLGFDISERTVLRWMRKVPRSPEPARRWAAFLSNHREAIAAMDFFAVPTLTFGILYCFFVIAHDRRRILHCNVTQHPTSAWVIQQLREAFPYDSTPGYLIFDRGTQFNSEVIDTMKSFGIQPKRTSFRSPWQNGVAERWVGTRRRDLLDHVIVLNERHLKRLISEYVRYYNEDRTHLTLAKGTPASRKAVINSGVGGRITSMPRIGGLHHRYELAA